MRTAVARSFIALSALFAAASTARQAGAEPLACDDVTGVKPADCSRLWGAPRPMWQLGVRAGVGYSNGDDDGASSVARIIFGRRVYLPTKAGKGLSQVSFWIPLEAGVRAGWADFEEPSEGGTWDALFAPRVRLLGWRRVDLELHGGIGATLARSTNEMSDQNRLMGLTGQGGLDFLLRPGEPADPAPKTRAEIARGERILDECKPLIFDAQERWARIARDLPAPPKAAAARAVDEALVARVRALREKAERTVAALQAADTAETTAQNAVGGIKAEADVPRALKAIKDAREKQAVADAAYQSLHAATTSAPALSIHVALPPGPLACADWLQKAEDALSRKGPLKPRVAEANPNPKTPPTSVTPAVQGAATALAAAEQYAAAHLRARLLQAAEVTKTDISTYLQNGTPKPDTNLAALDAALAEVAAAYASTSTPWHREQESARALRRLAKELSLGGELASCMEAMRSFASGGNTEATPTTTTDTESNRRTMIDAQRRLDQLRQDLEWSERERTPQGWMTVGVLVTSTGFDSDSGEARRTSYYGVVGYSF